MTGETSRTLLRISEREVTVRSFLEKSSVSSSGTISAIRAQKCRKKKISTKNNKVIFPRKNGHVSFVAHVLVCPNRQVDGADREVCRPRSSLGRASGNYFTLSVGLPASGGEPLTAIYVVPLQGTRCSKIEMVGRAHPADLNLHFAPKGRNMNSRRRKPAEQETPSGPIIGVGELGADRAVLSNRERKNGWRMITYTAIIPASRTSTSAMK
jgi:hypothetical protein